MFSQATRLLVVCVIVYVVHLAPTVSQCTTKYCVDDNNKNDVDVLTAMVSRLQNTVERLEEQEIQEKQHQASIEQLQNTVERLEEQEKQEKQHQASIEQLQNTVERLERQNEQYVDSLEKQEKQHQASIEQLQQQFNDSLEQQQKYVTKLKNTMKENISTLEHVLMQSLPAKDCYDLLQKGYTHSGVYAIHLVKERKFVKVYCDMETDGGGWLVFQRRQDGSVDFYRNWASYKEGFGDVSGEFWLGNEYLHAVTAQKQYKLRIDLEDFNSSTRYAVYSNFAVADEDHKYRLSLGAYSGTAGDAFTYHAGMAFSTKDRDNDLAEGHCAQHFKGGWWYNACYYCNLNGLYFDGANGSYKKGISWNSWHHAHSLKKVEMKLRP